jgi:hypothetical protein
VTVEQLLTNRTITSFHIVECAHCWIALDGGYVIGCDSLLRFVGNDGVFFSNKDHGHQFGRPNPLDCEGEIDRRVKNQKIVSVDIAPTTGDLTLRLDNGCIEIICTSAPCENWQLEGRDGSLFIDLNQRRRV